MQRVSQSDVRPDFVELASHFNELVAGSGLQGVFDANCYAYGTLGKTDLHEDDLDIGELHMEALTTSLLVTGNLTVRGLLKQDFRSGFLTVLGNVSARSILTTSQLNVGGDLRVEDTLYGNCTNYTTNALGMTTARLLVSAKEHHFTLLRGHRFDLVEDVGGRTPNMSKYATGSRRPKLVLSADELFDDNLVFETLRRRGTLIA